MSNGHLPNQWYEGEETEMANNINDEKQTVLYLKRNGDGQAGIETILKRELQGMFFYFFFMLVLQFVCYYNTFLFCL